MPAIAALHIAFLFGGMFNALHRYAMFSFHRHSPSIISCHVLALAEGYKASSGEREVTTFESAQNLFQIIEYLVENIFAHLLNPIFAAGFFLLYEETVDFACDILK